MIRRILVPLDGSDVAERILPTVSALAHRLGAEVILFRAVPPLAQAVVLPDGKILSPREYTEQEEWRARAYLERKREVLEAAKVQVHAVDVAVGKPAQAILEAEERWLVDLVAMGTHGRGGLGRLLVGSVADKVIRAGARPVLVQRTDREGPPVTVLDPILVPLDGSPLAETVLPTAVGLARGLGSRLILFRVVTPVLLPEPVGAPLPAQSLKVLEEEALAYLERTAEGLRREGVEVTVATATGTPAQEIVAVAQSRRVRLICMATHGYTGLRRVLLGSVTEAVIQTAPIPVLVTRAGLE